MKIEFVEGIPRELEQGAVYVSMTFAIVAHNCFCGCGHQVVTPLSPVDWKLTFDGEAISLYPSIGNWYLDCKSHYWIRNGHVIWAERWSDADIQEGRRQESVKKADYYSGRSSTQTKRPDQDDLPNETSLHGRSWWAVIRDWLMK